MAEELKPVFKSSYGSSERNWGHNATEDDIDCQMCGKSWLSAGEGVSTSWTYFQQRQLVLACCGKFVDEVFEQWGDMFVEGYLDDFKKNPTNDKFRFFRGYQLSDALVRAKEVISTTGEEVDRLINQL